MNAEARKLGLTDSHFVRPDGLDAPGEYSSARDVVRLALAAMRIPAVRATVAETTATLADGFVVHTWDDLLGVFPGVFGVKTGHTSAAHWNQVTAVRGDGTVIYAAILGSPSRARRDADLETLLAYGLAQYRQVVAVERRPQLRAGPPPLRPRSGRARREAPDAGGRAGRLAPRRACGRPDRRLAAASARTGARTRRDLGAAAGSSANGRS